MILLATIVTILFVGDLDALNIFKNYQTISNYKDNDLAVYKNSEAIADSYELLGLIILDYNPISRRDNDVAAKTNLTKTESGEYEKYEDNGNEIEPRSKRRRKKKRYVNSNDNAKQKNENKQTLKILGDRKVRIVEQKLIELIKEKLKKPLNSEAKRKIQMFNEVQGRNKQNSGDKLSSSKSKIKEINKLNKDGVKSKIRLDDSKKESPKESVIEKNFKKTERYYNNENTEHLRKQKKEDKHKYFNVDTKERSEERPRQEKRKGKKQKKVETSSEAEILSKPKRFDVVGKGRSNEFDRNVKLKKKPHQSKDGTEEEEGKARGGKNKNECINESQTNIDKCVRACQRTHEDVCDLLTCSQKSLKALRIECSVSCKKVFPILC
ncbi:unnamed protein product [Spodoptera littoralis]|uniref:Uncharacterized protein n=1 Tax=Spodoptera littoralis TaxID=7109 RepID=A0A9P0I9E5_SPOLI|nr:unnamed protein product [Spodoptera littoralis]